MNSFFLDYQNPVHLQFSFLNPQISFLIFLINSFMITRSIPLERYHNIIVERWMQGSLIKEIVDELIIIHGLHVRYIHISLNILITV